MIGIKRHDWELWKILWEITSQITATNAQREPQMQHKLQTGRRGPPKIAWKKKFSLHVEGRRQGGRAVTYENPNNSCECIQKQLEVSKTAGSSDQVNPGR